MKLSNKLYDILKWIALVALDAIGMPTKDSLVWGLPFGDQVHTTCTILSVLLGTLIGVSSVAYAKRGE